jgi:hypothetical protein
MLLIVTDQLLSGLFFYLGGGGGGRFSFEYPNVRGTLFFTHSHMDRDLN